MSRERKPSDFVTRRRPVQGKLVEVLCEDGSGRYVLPFHCRVQDGKWVSSADRPVAVEIVGWREPRSKSGWCR